MIHLLLLLTQGSGTAPPTPVVPSAGADYSDEIADALDLLTEFGNADYSTEIADALELLTQYGIMLTITRTIQGTPNKATDRTTTQPVKVTAQVQAVTLPIDLGKLGGADTLEEMALIASGARKILIAGAGMTVTSDPVDGFTGEFIPTAGDLIVLEGKPWKVVGNSPLKPSGGPTILHKTFIKN